MIRTEALDATTEIFKPGRVLDNNNAHEVMQAVDAVLAAGKQFIVFDMGEVEFLSSSGVGSLISSLAVLRGNGGSLALCNLSEKVVHVLETLDLQDFIPIESDLESALALLRTRQPSTS